jgi:hypothetical protein
VIRFFRLKGEWIAMVLDGWMQGEFGDERLAKHMARPVRKRVCSGGTQQVCINMEVIAGAILPEALQLWREVTVPR